MIKVLSVCNGGELVHFVKMTIAAMVMFIGLVPQLVKSFFNMERLQFLLLFCIQFGMAPVLGQTCTTSASSEGNQQ